MQQAMCNNEAINHTWPKVNMQLAITKIAASGKLGPARGHQVGMLANAIKQAAGKPHTALVASSTKLTPTTCN